MAIFCTFSTNSKNNNNNNNQHEGSITFVDDNITSWRQYYSSWIANPPSRQYHLSWRPYHWRANVPSGSDCHWYLSTNMKWQWQSLPATGISQPIRRGAYNVPCPDNDSLHAQTQASVLLTFISHIWGVLRRTDLRVVLFERWHV